MKVIERYIQSKYDLPDLCEDGIFQNENYVAVIDGVTPKGKIKWHEHTSGYYAKEIILQGLSQLRGNETAEEALSFLNAALHREYGDRADFFRDNPEERLQATLVIFSVLRRQIWCFGDCQFMINGELFAEEMKIDALLAEVRSVYLKLEMKQGKTIQELCAKDPSIDVIWPVLKKQILFSNCDCEYGFSVLDGLCNDYRKTAVKDVPPDIFVILASDGYPKLMETLELSEAELERIRLNDPLCIEIFKSTRGWTDGKKSLDDKAYIKIKT